MCKTRDYQWIVDRARGGEPVPIDTERGDIGQVIDFLCSVDGRGLAMQLDNKFGLLWIVRSDEG